jgi:hypothetical protein
MTDRVPNFSRAEGDGQRQDVGPGSPTDQLSWTKTRLEDLLDWLEIHVPYQGHSE